MSGATHAAPTMRAIQAATCLHFGVTPGELIGSSRLPRLVRARHVAMFLCRELTAKKLLAIGRGFGMRGHSTVWHACGSIEAHSAGDAGLAADLAALRLDLT
jgi:chromosomal replication initiator protein